MRAMVAQLKSESEDLQQVSPAVTLATAVLSRCLRHSRCYMLSLLSLR